MNQSIKQIVILVAISFSMIAVNAQEMYVVNKQVLTAPTSSVILSDQSELASGITEESLAETNPKLLKSFNNLFPTAGNELWSRLDNNYFVSFEKNGNKSRASFNSKGLLNYIISTCNVQNLPEAFQQTISKKYSAYTMYNASQIKAYETEVYQAILENSTGFITLRFSEEETTEISKINKGAVN
jgi:hypothetical protein